MIINLIFLLLESEKFQKVTNHPVHIVDDKGNLSPSALIPFCALGGDLSAMGVKIEKINKTIDVPVCNSFRPILVEDQLCYQVDPNKYIKNLPHKERKLNLILFIDFNEDRWIPLKTKKQSEIHNGNDYDFKEDQDNNIIINTIGKIVHILILFFRII